MVRNLYTKYVKQINLWYFIFSALFSMMLIISCHIFYDPNGNSTVETAFVTDFSFMDFIGIALLIPLIYLALHAVLFCLKAAAEIFWSEERKPKIWVLLGFFAFIMILWFPYLPSYWPGGIYADTVDSINMALGKMELDSHNPVLYTMIWKFMFWITGAFSGQSEYRGLNLFTVVQTMSLAFMHAGFLYYCYRKGIHKKFIALLLFIVGLYPLYPYYGVSMWKDTLFSMAIFIFSVFLYDVFKEKTEDVSVKQMVLYGVLSVLIMFLRNNGIYIALFYSLIIVLMCVKNRRAIAKKLGIVSLVLIVGSWIIQGPVWDKCGYNIDRAVESFGVPIQQTAYIVSTNGNVGDEELAVLNEIMPLENWQALYNPVVADTIKFDPSFNRDYFEEHTDEFLKAYMNLVLKNPVKAVKAYFLETLGFWNVFESSSTAYVCNFHFWNAEYFMSDYFDYHTDISFRDMVEPKTYLSAAIFVWVMLAAICICLGKRNYMGIIPMLPTLGLWLSVMVATPVGFSFRYVYAVFLCVPLYLIICIGANREKD